MAFRALALLFCSDEELKGRANIINSFDKKKVILPTLLFKTTLWFTKGDLFHVV